jgi:hypothetical protein
MPTVSQYFLLHGRGSRFSAAEDLAILETKRLIQGLKGHEAARIARSIIAAANRISETIQAALVQ